tara:strand:+ start:31 stop:507 length:477 start_codon:yes stop_codon:yes gene_type:complete
MKPEIKRDLNEEILHYVCKELKQEPEFVLQNLNSRKKELVEVRQIHHYLKYTLTKQNLENVGFYFKKDHTTVVHSNKKIKGYIDSSKEYEEMINKIINEVNSNTVYSIRPTKRILNKSLNNFIREIKEAPILESKTKDSIKDFVRNYKRLLDYYEETI